MCVERFVKLFGEKMLGKEMGPYNYPIDINNYKQDGSWEPLYDDYGRPWELSPDNPANQESGAIELPGGLEVPVADKLLAAVGITRAEVQMLRTYEDGRPVYRIDWNALDTALAADHTPLMIFCSPQNPTGQIWDRGTMMRIGALCQAHGVTVLSDEIHSDIVMPGKRCLPFAAASEVNLGLTATFLAPTKSFNIMGLKSAAVCTADPGLRGKILSALGDLAGANAFAAPATIAAFTEGGEWLDALCAYIFHNKARVDEFLASELPEIVSVPSEATYLMWLDIGKITGDSGEFYQYLRRETGLYVCPGSWYRGDGARFLRFNAACPRSLLEDGLDRLKAGVRKYEAEHGITP